jgi:hypothetical protein
VIRRPLLLAAALVVGVSSVGAPPVRAATYTVTTLNDAGVGSLREAIVDANASAGADTIVFDAGLTGTITLASDFPNITEDLTITGPGEDDLTIDGVASHRPFWVNLGVSFTLSDMTLKRGRSTYERGSLIHNQQGTITVTDLTFRDDRGWAASFNLSGGSVATFTRCSFINNNVGIGGDHGSTPSTTSSTETDYQNRTYVINSLFEDNTYGIKQERFTTITGSTFRNNTFGATIQGLNRSQVYNSTFEDNTYGITHSNWTDTSWTLLGSNNRLHDGNTFINNTYAIYLNDGWNNGQKSQRWSTVTNNTWDGEGTWILATEWNGTTNETLNKTTVNNTGVTWTESGNIIRLSTPPTTAPAPAPAPAEDTTTTSTTVPAPTTTVIAPPVATRANALPETGRSVGNLQLSLVLLGLATMVLALRRRLIR